MDLNKCVVYDVEVLRGPDHVDGGWDNPAAMGFSSAVAYSYEKDRYYFFLHQEEISGLLKLLDHKTAVSFNGIHFDSRVILGNDRAIDRFGRISRDGLWFDNYDILLEYVRSRYNYNTVRQAEARLGDKTIHDGSFGLDGLAEGTLGLNKIGHGAKAPELYKDGKYEDLLAYNLQDVRLTRKLFEFVRFYRYLTDRLGKAIKIPIDYIG